MPNGALKKAIYATIGALLVLSVGAVGKWGISRASDDDVDTVLVATQSNATRLENHEREANAFYTKILINQSAFATSIDFLVAKQDPSRKPIEPTIEVPTAEAEED